MIEKILEYINEHQMLQEGDTVVAGVSGGADSVCLLFVLLKIRETIPFRLTAVHMNHKIREEAGEDAAFVEALCGTWNCPYRYMEADVEAYALGHHMSCEEAGRFLRYQAFAQVLEEEGAEDGKVAVAHNKNDHAETVLFHLLRGSGLAGLTGIHPVRGRVIRPLLCVTRPEIEAFLEENQLAYCIDKTNSEDTYTRNKIRHHMLAYAEQEVCSQAVSHIYDTSVIVREALAYVDCHTQMAMERCGVASEKDMIFDVAAFEREEPLIQKQLLLMAMERLSENRKDISAVHIRLLLGLFTRQGNASVDLPCGLRAYREYGRVRLAGRERERAESAPGVLRIPGVTRWGGYRFVCQLLPYEKSQIIPQKTYTKWFDYDKISKYLVLRTRQSGDYLMTRGDGGRKSLKAYMIGEKIPQAERDRIPVLADGEHIVWVVGHRISGHYKTDRQTKTVLQIRVTGGSTDGGED